MPSDPVKPKPKRVRREKLELAYLRDLVGELESKRTLLRSKRLNQLKTGCHDSGIAAASLVSRSNSEIPSTWMGLAALQLRDRSLAVERNQKLRCSIRGYIELVSKLQQLFHKQIPQKDALAESASSARDKHHKFWDLSANADEEIFTDQLATVARLRLELQQRGCEVPATALSLNWGLSRGHMMVKQDENKGAVLEMHCGTTVPFKLEVAARAYWRFFCLEHGERSLGDSGAKLSNGTIARSFSLRLEFEGLVSEVTGKYTCQTNMEEDKITIVWVEHADVFEFGGIKFNGLQYQKRASMTLRRVPREGRGNESTSTVVETYFQTVPVFHDCVADKLQQTRAFIDSAHRSHSKLDKIVCQHMSNLLLEEDWKATFG
ncbi:hypothetical protein PC128_g9028 [Phytophthora cactorum]|nr:hypothetical protein PC120_g12124 [Phytophthora cactorum]KAG3061711.1 hypothetical protein PC121_g12864 [Phytophthora cactorum]KAG3194804.1 hypothetical protein PC128_g9028 [Phytophthora cactorum]KAG4049146.1 hypothetical protein PC123_g15561 [Phytophthora cactorum]